MGLNVVWFILLGVLLAGYAILDGFDLGVGMMHMCVRKDEERRALLKSIGPLWDGNEVWLVVFAGATFAAFPDVYATALSAFYLPFMILLAALISRAVSIEFRNKAEYPPWRTFWDVAFSAASLLIAFLFGAAVGNSLEGLPIGPDREYSGNLLDLVRPYPVLLGVFAIATFLMHGSLYLYLKTAGVLQARVREWAWRTFGLFLIMYIASTILTWLWFPEATEKFREHPWISVMLLLNILAITNIPRAISHARPLGAFVSSGATIASFTFLFGFALFPNMLVSTAGARYSLTITNSASSPLTQGIMLIIVAIGLPFALAYTAIIFWVFREKVQLGDFPSPVVATDTPIEPVAKLPHGYASLGLLEAIQATKPRKILLFPRVAAGLPVLLLGSLHWWKPDILRGFVEAGGLPIRESFLAATPALEILAGVLLLLGFFTRVGGLIALVVMIPATMFELQSPISSMIIALLPAAIVVASTISIVCGGGSWSVDESMQYARKSAREVLPPGSQFTARSPFLASERVVFAMLAFGFLVLAILDGGRAREIKTDQLRTTEYLAQPSLIPTRMIRGSNGLAPLIARATPAVERAEIVRVPHPKMQIDRPTNAQSLFNKGAEAHAQHNHAAAIAHYSQAIKIDPTATKAFYNRALAHLSEGDPASAANDFAEILKIDPNDTTIRLDRALALGQLQRDDEALTELDKVLAIQPNQDAYLHRGLVHFSMKQYDRAKADFDKTLELNPKNLQALYNRGLVYMAENDSDSALADFEKALSQKPFLNGYFERGLALLKKGEVDRGIADFSKVIAINPNDAEAHHNRGLALLRKREFDAAISDFTEAIRLNPQKPPYYERGLAYYEKKDFVRADRDDTVAIERDDKNFRGYYNRGLARYWLREYDAAIADFSHAIELESEDAPAYLARSLAYRQKGNIVASSRDRAKALKLEPNLKAQ